MPETEVGAHPAARPARFAFTKFRPPRLPRTLVPRVNLHARLDAAASACLTVVSGSAGAGKSVLLASWAATRSASATAWLSCDDADRAGLRFCLGLIEAVRTVSPGFGDDAAELLVVDGEPSVDAVSLLVNDLGELSPGTAIIIDDFHLTSPAVESVVSDLVERWPPSVQLVLAARSDPSVRLHRLRMMGELVELRDRDLIFSLTDVRQLLVNFDVDLSAASSAALHDRSEGWVMALQMAALSLQVSSDAESALQAVDPRTHAIAEYFVAEVLDRQPKEVAAFMIESSVLDELTPEACGAVTEQPDPWRLLRTLDRANLFVIAVDDDRCHYRFHQLIRDVLRAELQASTPARRARLHTRAADWFQSTGDTRQAIRHLLEAGEADRAFQLLSDSVLPGYVHKPRPEQDFPLDVLTTNVAGRTPAHILALSLELLLRGDVPGGVACLELLDRSGTVEPGSPLATRLQGVCSWRDGLLGKTGSAIQLAESSRSADRESGHTDAWLWLALANVYVWLGDYDGVQRELEAGRGLPAWPRAAPPIRALALAEAGYVDDAATLAEEVAADAAHLGFDRHPSAAHTWRALTRVAIERRDFAVAEQHASTAIEVAEQHRPPTAFLAHLDRAEILAAGGHLDAALSEISVARSALPAASSALLVRADHLEALVLLAGDDIAGAAGYGEKLPTPAGSFLRARIALARADAGTAVKHLGSDPQEAAVPRDRLMHLVLRAAAAIELDSPDADPLVNRAIDLASSHGLVNAVVAPTAQVTGHLVESSSGLYRSPHLDRLIAAAVDVRATESVPLDRRRTPIDPLTKQELKVLRLLPTSLPTTQIAATLYVSVNTVKTHLRRIYMKLDVRNRAEAVERAVELHLL